ncbi:MAG: hypothetical protein ACHQ49_07450 [Elusimicrobiota bacterium]
MPQAASPQPSAVVGEAMGFPMDRSPAGRRNGRAGRDACESVPVSGPSDLCRVQATTRELCRAMGMDEPTVFSTVIAVTELAHRLFVEPAREGRILLSAAGRGRRRRLLIEAVPAAPAYS